MAWTKVETNIYKNTETGRYRVDVTLNGRRLRPEEKSVARCRTLLGQLRAKSVEDPYGFAQAREKVTFGSALSRFKEYRLGENLAEATAHLDDHSWAIIESVIDTRTTLPLRQEHIGALEAKLRAKRLAVGTRNQVLGRLRLFCNYCETVAEFYPKGRSPEIRRVRERRSGREDDFRVLSAEEEARMEVLAATGSPKWVFIWSFVRFILATGLRIHEAAELTWHDVKADRIMVYSRKTDKWRFIPLRGPDGPLPLQGLLEEIRGRQVGSPKTVFATPFTGVPIATRGGAWRDRYWYPFLRASGVTDLRVHDLRHTFCSRAAAAGVPIPVLQLLAGHATIKMTMRYVHMDEEAIFAGMAVMSAAMTADDTKTTPVALDGPKTLEKQKVSP